MEKLSKNFNRSEFACKGQHCCGGSAPVHPDLIKGLQALREIAGAPLIITSGFRCRNHNRDVGGAPDSFHTLGMAADVRLYHGRGTPEDLAKLAELIPFFNNGGIGIYESWVHLDVRKSGKARWTFK